MAPAPVKSRQRRDHEEAAHSITKDSAADILRVRAHAAAKSLYRGTLRTNKGKKFILAEKKHGEEY